MPGLLEEGFYKATLLFFPNVKGPNNSNHDSEMGHFVRTVTLRIYPLFYSRFFQTGSTGVFCSVTTVSSTVVMHVTDRLPGLGNAWGSIGNFLAG